MGVRFHSIVLALDLQEDAGPAVPVAGALARAGNLPVEVVAAVSDDADHRLVRQELERSTAAGGLGHATCYLVGGDDPGRAITENVVDRDGVLLVLAATTWRSSGPHVFDATAEAILGEVLHPAVVVGPRHAASPARTTRPVAVVDETDNADAAMPVVESWIRTFPSTEPSVVTVLPPTGVAIPDGDVTRDVQRYVDQLAEHGVAAAGEVIRSGEPVDALLTHAARDADAMLVVTSPRWAGGASHWFNTTRRLVQYSTRPVLVVPADRPGFRPPSRPCAASAATGTE
jgi:nucleotide-binding universal stress UspA family protein